MPVFAYARVSTIEQHTDLQKNALLAKYPDAKYIEEKTSGTSLKNREKLSVLLNIVGEGDKLVVWRLDRLARDMHDLTVIVKMLEEKGAGLEILDQSIDTSTASGKAFLQMLGVFAEFETNIRKERQKEGIEAAKRKGKRFGRPSKLTDEQKDQIIRKRREGATPTSLANEYGCSRALIYMTTGEVIRKRPDRRQQ